MEEPWKRTDKLLEKTSAALAQIKEQIRLNGGVHGRKTAEPATSKDVEVRLCEAN